MSIAILEGLQSWLDTGNLMDGYQTRYNRWTDADEDGDGEFMVFRVAGPGGQSNRILQMHDVRVMIVASPASVVAAQNRADAIVDYLRAATQPTDVVRYEVLANPQGPFYTTNGRGVIEINVRAYQSGDVPT